MNALVLTVAFGVLFALSFPFRADDFRFDVGAVAGWLAFAPLALLLRGQPPRAAFRRAFFAAWLGYAGVIWWLYIVITIYGRAAPYAGVAGALGVAAYCALCGAVAAALAAWLAPHAGRAAPLLFPAAWILAERSRALVSVAGFPWAFLGYSVHADAPMRGLASLCGVYGLSFALALAGTLLAERRFVAALALAAGLHAVGWLALPGPLAQPEGAKPLRVAMVQGDVPEDEKWDPALMDRHFESQVALTHEALAQHPDLVTWPESGFPGVILAPEQDRVFTGLADWQERYRDPLLGLVRESGVPLVLGAVGVTQVAGRRVPDIANSVFVLAPGPDGPAIADRYDKTVLVPFGEYVPLRALFGSLQAVATGLADLSDLTPGPGPRTLRGLGSLGADHALAGLICYEVVYPSVVRAVARDGARVLLNLTNDAWYGRSSAPHQFLAIAQLRSAEHGLPMLRDANTGVSALIDASGAIVEETPIFERRVLVAEVTPPRPSATFYTRAGDWPLWLGAAWLLAVGGRAVVGRGRR
ncbi:MAG TPA: apolipoprotein N-acyltransferase [Myxococcota bacterium]|nr:apolipoprotein N-acyltransferase [Myxococcota bacterium]